MKAEGVFSVKSFTPAEVAPAIEVTTAVDVGVATMEKGYEGDIVGRSSTLFTSAYDQAAGIGTYVAMESFDGALNGTVGTFNFVHSATTGGTDRTDELFLIVPASGTAGLAGISGTGAMAVEDDGTHRVWFEYELPS